MGKKDKKKLSLEDDIQAVISMLPKLERLLKNHKEVAKEYQKYRKNGGDEIPGLEKHLSCSENTCCHCDNEEKTVTLENSPKPETTEEVTKAKKAKKKDK